MKYINGSLTAVLETLVKSDDSSQRSVLFYPGSYTEFVQALDLDHLRPLLADTLNFYVVSYEAYETAELLEEMLKVAFDESELYDYRFIVWSFMHLVASRSESKSDTCVAGIVDLISIFKDLGIPHNQIVLADNVFLNREILLEPNGSDKKISLELALKRVCDIIDE